MASMPMNHKSIGEAQITEVQKRNEGRGETNKGGKTPESPAGNENKGMNKCKLHDIQNNEREHLREQPER